MGRWASRIPSWEGWPPTPQRKKGGRGRAADRRRCRPFLNGRPPVRCLEQVVHNDVCATGLADGKGGGNSSSSSAGGSGNSSMGRGNGGAAGQGGGSS